MPALVRAILVAVIAPAVLAMRPAPVATPDPSESLQATGTFEKTLECLAMNVYHEARSEPLATPSPRAPCQTPTLACGCRWASQT